MTSSVYIVDSSVAPATLGGVLGLSVIINIILLIVVVVLVTKRKNTSLSLPPSTSGAEDKDIEMKPNSLYGLTSGSESIVTKPNEVYGVSMTSEHGHPATYEYVNP